MSKTLAALAVLTTLGAHAPGLAGPVDIAPLGKQPRVAVAADGLVAVVYGHGSEIFSRVSRDGGASYAEPVRVGEAAKLMLGMRRGPQIAASATGFAVTAISKDGSLLAWRSADAGRTWTGPVTVNDRPGSAREGLHALAAGARWTHAVWLDLRDERMKIFASRSTDAGRAWEPNRLVYESPDGAVCECCQPSVAADDRGGVVVMWRNSLGGARDMFLVRSNDGGRSFGDAGKLGHGTWPLRACPMDGGGVAVIGEQLTTVWRREDVVYSAAPGAAEETLGKGRNAVVALSDGTVYMAWQTPENEIVLKRSGAAAVPVGRGRFAAIGAAANGKGPVVLAWEDPERGAVALAVAAAKSERGSARRAPMTDSVWTELRPDAKQ
jgi:hypothetical protein